MQKQKNACAKVFFLSFLLVGFVAGGAKASNSFYGNATASWTAPTTDEGGGALGGGTSDLAGYRIYYSTSPIDCTSWNAAPQTGTGSRQSDAGTLLPSTYAVASGTATSFTFNNTTLLTPKTLYYFAIVAYDTSGNISQCTQTTGSQVSKTVTYTGDMDNNGCVDYRDYGTFHQYYNTSNSSADLNRDGTVNYLDYGILHTNYNQGTCSN